MSHSEKIEKVHLWGIKSSIFLILFLPLYISPSMVFPYITGKNFAFRILTEFAAAFWAVLLIFKKEYRPRYSPLALSILAFTFIVGLADLLGVHPYKSFWSNYERMEGYITILHLVLFFMIIKSVFRTKKDWMTLFNILLVVVLLVCVFSLSVPVVTKGQRFWMEYGERIYGSIGNPPFLASYLLLAIFVGLIALTNARNNYLKTFHILIVLLSTFVIYLTATRGAILAGIVGLIVMILFHMFKGHLPRRNKTRTILITLMIICSILIAVAVMTSGNIELVKRDLTLSRFLNVISSESVKTRLNVWQMAWNGFMERPLLGWGQENFISIYTVNRIPLVAGQIWLDRAHNIIIEWLINAGIFGLSSYLAIFGTAFFMIRKKYLEKLISKKESVIIVTGLLVYFIQNLFTFDTINSYFIFFILMAYIESPFNSEDDSTLSSENHAEKKHHKAILYLGSMLLALSALSTVIYYVNYRPIKEARLSLYISVNQKKYKSFLTLLRDFNKALSLKTFGDFEVRQKMALHSHQIIKFKQYSQEGALKFIQITARELGKGLSVNWYNLEHLTDVIILYKTIAFYENSFVNVTESIIKRGIQLNPRYEWLYFALADTYKLKKEYEEAYKIVDDMVANDPGNDQKQLKLALAAIPLKKENVVLSALEEIKKIRMKREFKLASGSGPLIDLHELYFIVEAYIEINDYEKAIYYLKQIISVYPGHLIVAKYHFALARVYLYLGENDNAIKEAKKAAELNPAVFEKVVQNFLNRIEYID